MNNRLVVRNIADADRHLTHGIFIYCVGYETRSRFLAEQYSTRPELTVAIEYTEGRVLSFNENRHLAELRGFTIVTDVIGNIEAQISKKLAQIRSDGQRGDIAVDVSSMDRSLMSRIILFVLDSLREGETLTLLYCPSKFYSPPQTLIPIRHTGAVHPSLAGEVAAPDMQRVALIGLGYEYGVALSILETHEPDMTFIFRPNGSDKQFVQAVSVANFGFDFGDRNYEIIDYFINDMAGTYDDISSLINSTKYSSSIVCVPLGPKILSAVMIIAGRVHQPQASVLRYSVAMSDTFSDSQADGSVTGITVALATASADVGRDD
ncbi:hypothetical protein [Tardiphaga sp. 862_B3_N1_1]|uniref:hypothetical protein n=1 Tax=Tardiphaga sp. 862_B3_N1_1 TaxID=3240763 RepID=UPI003F890B5F